VASSVLSDTADNVNGVWTHTAGLLLGNGVWTQTAGLLLGFPTVALFLKLFRPAGVFPYILLLFIQILLFYLLLFFMGVCFL